jgi:DNA-binding CsgD family transcriptional regulator/phage portal protein BeeE
MNLYRDLANRVRMFTRMVFARWPRSRGYFGGAGMRGERNYEAYVGDGRGSALLMACISWVVNAFVQMQVVVMTTPAEGELFGEKSLSHPMARLFRRPTYDPDTGRSFFTWMTLIAGVIISFIVDGNAYLLKVRGAGGSGRPVQLWYVPHWMMTPVWDPETPAVFIAYYDYCPDGQNHYRVRIEDVIHLRDGIDPDNTRKGLSKTKVLLREIMTDEQAAQWTVSLLINHAVPGLVLAPKMPLEDPNDAQTVKDRIQQQFTADNRGMTIVLGGPTDIVPYGFSPEQMKLGDIRDIPEERISAAIGIAAAVVGFGSGLQSTKVGATMAELVDLSWQNAVTPRSIIIGAEVTEQLAPDFGEDPEGIGLMFDTTQVPIMADHHLKVAQRHELLMKGGMEMRSQAKRALGFPTGPDDDVYVVQAGVTFVRPNGKPLYEPPKPIAAPAAPALAPGPTPPEPAPAKTLTNREREVAGMMATKTNRQIADALGISVSTIDTHTASVMSKLGVHSRTEVAV